MSSTPVAERLHITIYGRRNAGKSSLLNLLIGQDVALVSAMAGTTTDPVGKAIELGSLGPCLLTDTAGFDDDGALGTERVGRTERTLARTDVALLLVSDLDNDLSEERRWLDTLAKSNIPTLLLLGKSDLRADASLDAVRLRDTLGYKGEVIPLHHQDPRVRQRLIEAIAARLPKDYGAQSITGRLVQAGDVVVLVMPQDASAPKGRLILPQVQTIRELLDKGCITLCCTPDRLTETIGKLASLPKLIITDSQAFAEVYAHKPEGVMLTSFSVLMAAYKGDIDLFVEGAKAFDRLTDTARILIAEACTHAPTTEDIGRVKIPTLLRKRYGAGLVIDIVSGADFPEDLERYDLIIHCGACMFNRAHVLSRLERIRHKHIPVTNYGICLAYLTGILDKITI